VIDARPAPDGIFAATSAGLPDLSAKQLSLQAA
jgi:hypothetical protein